MILPYGLQRIGNGFAYATGQYIPHHVETWIVSGIPKEHKEKLFSQLQDFVGLHNTLKTSVFI